MNMLKNIRPLTALALTAAVLVAGCASSKGEGYTRPGYDLNSIGRVAIVNGRGTEFAMDSERALMDIYQMEFLRRGWNIVERSNIQQAIDELNFQNSDLASQSNRGALGNVLNADALVIVNMEMGDNEVTMTAKMLETATGELIWMGSGDGSLNKTLGTITGALVGAGVGAAVGDSGGTVAIGGVLGGAAGYAMGPSELENAKDVVKAVCETLPPRFGTGAM